MSRVAKTQENNTGIKKVKATWMKPNINGQS